MTLWLVDHCCRLLECEVALLVGQIWELFPWYISQRDFYWFKHQILRSFPERAVRDGQVTPPSTISWIDMPYCWCYKLLLTLFVLKRGCVYNGISYEEREGIFKHFYNHQGGPGAQIGFVEGMGPIVELKNFRFCHGSGGSKGMIPEKI